MTLHPDATVTELLQAAHAGDEEAEEELFRTLHGELKRLARSKLRRTGGQTLQTTALVNEAYLRMLGNEASPENRRHFFFVAARAMHDILVDRARRRTSGRRGAGWKRAGVERLELAFEVPADDMLALSEALSRLEAEDPAKARLVHLRFFAGLSEVETAAVLGVSRRTVQREWSYVRARLYRELEDAS